MAFIPKNWEDAPSPATPISAVALEDMEIRLATYADSIAGTDPDAVPKSMYSEYGGILKGGLTPGDPEQLSLGTPGQVLTVLPLAGAVWATPDSGGGGDVPPVPPVYPDGAALVSDSSTETGLDWSIKAADYNIMQAGATPGFSGATIAAENRIRINAAFVSAAAAGRPCVIPPAGVFYHDIGIKLPSNLHVRGFGKGRSVLKTDTSVGVDISGNEMMTNLDVNNGNSNITLENFEIDGNRDARGGVPWQPDGSGSAGHLTFRGNNESSPCHDLRLLNLTFHHAVTVGISFKNIDKLLVQGCEVYSNGRDGCSVLATGAQDVRYIGNKIYDCGDDCIAITSGGLLGENIEAPPHKNVVIANNNLGDHPNFPSGSSQYGGHGVILAGVEQAVVVGNTISDAAIGGIQISDGYGGSTPTRRCVIANNTIGPCGLQHVPSGVGEFGWGIEVTQKYGETISEIIIANNTIYSPMSHHIFLGRWGTSVIKYMKILNNDFLSGQGADFYTEGSGIAVEDAAANFIEVCGNTFRDMRNKAINGNGFACNGWTIADNQIYGVEKAQPGAGGAAIDITNFTNCRLYNNKVEDPAAPKNQSHAVAWGGAAGVRMFNNDFTGSGRTGTVTGPVSSQIQWNNINTAGTLMAGTVPTAGNLA